jgi:hypothetical protein
MNGASKVPSNFLQSVKSIRRTFRSLHHEAWTTLFQRYRSPTSIPKGKDSKYENVSQSRRLTIEAMIQL